MAARVVKFVHTSRKFETLDRVDKLGTWAVPWKRIPKTHYDKVLRSFRPGWFARSPIDADTVFIYRAKRS